MATLDFCKPFFDLTGNHPFPWQHDLYQRFISDCLDNIPSSGSIPTGLGKTSVIGIWLIALANHPQKMPRRLVYVVNRRTVVDQTTDEVVKLRSNLRAAGLFDPLKKLCAMQLEEDDPPLAISTLRGQFADNREWSADPARPAVIAGTVDMIGSRLLFSGYGLGFKSKPLHAGFLGQDVLLIHDEAHLEPAFQELLIAIQKEQERCKEFRRFRVMELTATSRGGSEAFELTQEEKQPPDKIPAPPTEPIHHVWMRLMAKKGIKFRKVKRNEVAHEIGRLARERKATGKAVLVFVRTIEDVKTVQQVLTDKKEGITADQVQVLTGTLRGLERDKLATADPVFARFLPRPKVAPKQGTVYLVCTSAGEVGVDISADCMVCDLTTFDSIAQRLGRVNRRGFGTAEIDLVYETDPDPKQKDKDYEKARWNTLEILKKLPKCSWAEEDRHEGSPLELRKRINAENDEERKAAFAPLPIILPTSDILFDAWTLTTIREKLPGRPPVEPYLHGISGWAPPETHVAWREEVWQLRLNFDEEQDQEEREAEERKRVAKLAADLLEDYPLKPHELLRDRSDRVFKHLATIAERCPSLAVWLLDDEGAVEVFAIKELADKDRKERINYRTILLPPDAGGLLLEKGESRGLLDATAKYESEHRRCYDVADEWLDEKGNQRRVRVWDDNPDLEHKAEGMRLVRTVELEADSVEDDAETKKWRWYVQPKSADPGWSAPVEQGLREHLDKAGQQATRIANALDLSKPLRTAVVLAANWHDLGKDREKWQHAYGNHKYPDKKIAKSGHRRPPVNLEHYRHEFGSLLDVLSKEPEFAQQESEVKELILHLIAAHHGRARPHFPAIEAFDPVNADRMWIKAAQETPGRFARFQRRYGRWGLAFLESLVRAADASASPEGKKGGAK